MHQTHWMTAALGATLLPLTVLASSHREAPFITTRSKVDGTDLYMFNSYEAGRTGYVTLIANYQPFENPQGGPNYYTMDPSALYEILIDNTGSGKEALTFQFRFTTVDNGLTVKAGTKSIPVPLVNIGPVSAGSTAAQNVAETYTLTLVRGDRRTGTVQPITDAATGGTTFNKPLDNIGAKSIADYPTYAASFIRTITIPGCNAPGRVFVGQRQDGFVVNLGETFDLVNIKYPVTELAPAGVNARQLAPNSLAGYNVTSIALEIPTACLTAGSDPVIGAWTTASLRQAAVLNPQPQSAKSVGSVGAVTTPTGAAVQGGAWSQVSRLGMPLVNELIIGLPDKDRFNASAPSGRCTVCGLRHQSFPARSAASPVRIFRSSRAQRLSAHRSRSGVSHRREGTESARDGHPRRGTAPQHQHTRDADRHPKRLGRARWRFVRISEWPPSD